MERLRLVANFDGKVGGKVLSLVPLSSSRSEKACYCNKVIIL